MKNARDYLAYMQEHPEEREFSRTLPPAEMEQHVKELGFEFTPAELQEEMELGVELAEEDLEAMSGGDCSGHCGSSCETYDSYCDCYNNWDQYMG